MKTKRHTQGRISHTTLLESARGSAPQSEGLFKRFFRPGKPGFFSKNRNKMINFYVKIGKYQGARKPDPDHKRIAIIHSQRQQYHTKKLRASISIKFISMHHSNIVKHVFVTRKQSQCQQAAATVPTVDTTNTFNILFFFSRTVKARI